MSKWYLILLLSVVDKDCGSMEFKCTSGQCVSSVMRCDGHHDCWDHSDEEGCTTAQVCTTKHHCPQSKECLVQEWICDGHQDCKDGSDEKVHAKQNKLSFEHWKADLTNVHPQTHLELPYFTVCFGRIVLWLRWTVASFSGLVYPRPSASPQRGGVTAWRTVKTGVMKLNVSSCTMRCIFLLVKM